MEDLTYEAPYYYFDISAKKWWILSGAKVEWKELSNEYAYDIGLFEAVRCQPCKFIDTSISEYNEAVSGLIDQLKLNSKKNDRLPKSEIIHRIKLASERAYSSPSHAEDLNSRLHVEERDTSINKSLEPEIAKSSSNGNKETDSHSGSAIDISHHESISSNRSTIRSLSSTEIQNQIDELITSTSEIRNNYEIRRESSKLLEKNEQSVRSAVRHVTMADRGGLTDCIKAVAEERSKMKTPVATEISKSQKDAKLQMMIERARSLAALSMETEKRSGNEVDVQKYEGNDEMSSITAKGSKECYDKAQDVTFDMDSYSDSRSETSDGEGHWKDADEHGSAFHRLLSKRVEMRSRTATIGYEE